MPGYRELFEEDIFSEIFHQRLGAEKKDFFFVRQKKGKRNQEWYAMPIDFNIWLRYNILFGGIGNNFPFVVKLLTRFGASR